MFFDIAKIVLPAVLSALLSGIWVSRWKASLDHAEKRIDDLCTEIIELADLASDYWITPQSDARIPVLQAKISSGLVRIATIRVTLSHFVNGLGDDRIVNLESKGRNMPVARWSSRSGDRGLLPLPEAGRRKSSA
jgi:hypothetical protein